MIRTQAAFSDAPTWGMLKDFHVRAFSAGSTYLDDAHSYPTDARFVQY